MARRAATESDLHDHCHQIILKRHHKKRLTCQICDVSITTFSNGNPHYVPVLNHARMHLKSPIFKCKKCDYKSPSAPIMRLHLHNDHSVSQSQYIDTTSDRIDELIQLVTRCFDPDSDAGKLPEVEIEDQVGKIETSKDEIGVDLAVSEGDYGSSSVQGSNGQDGTSEQIIKRRSFLPAYLRGHKNLCTYKVKKYIKDGKLECKFCGQWIKVSGNNSKTRIQRAYDHCMTHMDAVDLFECTTCDYRASNRFTMGNHVKKHSLGQRQFNDHTTKYYPKLLQMFTCCFLAETSTASTGNSDGNGTGKDGEMMGETR